MDQRQILKIGITIILGLILIFLVNKYYLSNNDTENFIDSDVVDEEDNLQQSISEEGNNYSVQPSENIGENLTFDKVEENNMNMGNQQPNDCFPRDKLTPEDLLPGDSNSQWAKVNPSGQGELKDQNFLDAGYHVGVNTVGQTLRNANLQIRSEPPNPQVKVSPWLQTTIEPDTNRQPTEIGGCQ